MKSLVYWLQQDQTQSIVPINQDNAMGILFCSVVKVRAYVKYAVYFLSFNSCQLDKGSLRIHLGYCTHYLDGLWLG